MTCAKDMPSLEFSAQEFVLKKYDLRSIRPFDLPPEIPVYCPAVSLLQACLFRFLSCHFDRP
jgi:hypothetical protein